MTHVLGDASAVADLGSLFGPLLYEAELAYLTQHEWAQSAEDVLKRRTKHGLSVSADEISRIEDWFKNGFAKQA